MDHLNIQSIVDLFNLPSKLSKKNVRRLVEQSFAILGQSESLTLIKQWEKLSSKLWSLNQLQCLSDKNHRLLLIYFIKHEAIDLYNNSYFNHAKIADDYISFVKEVGPFYFSEIITIVSRLKLISKHYQGRFNAKFFSQNHIDIKIMNILGMCNSKQRKGNTNLNKFQAIVEFQDDRNQLTKELGKMLRISWALEKKSAVHSQKNQIKGRSVEEKLINIHELMQNQSQSLQYNRRQSQQLYQCKCGKE